NNFRVGDLQLPQPLRPVAIDFSPLQSIGEGIGQWRLRQQLGEISQAATDANGNFDQNKATVLAARAGLLSPETLSAMGFRQQALAQTAAAQKETARHHGALEEFQNRPRYQYNQPDPILGGGSIIEERPGQPPVVRPWPG